MASTLRARSLLMTAVLLVSFAASAEENVATNSIVFKAHTENNRGVVRCGLFKRSGWLKTPVQSSIVRIHGKVAMCVFKRIPKNLYGVSGFHDENNNGKLDTNFVGMPVEDYGASRNARGVLGPPSFDDAKFQFTGGTKQLEARFK